MGQKSISWVVFAIILLSSNLININAQQNAIDRKCGNTLETLWLDVVIVIENTLGMTGDGLNRVIASAAYVFSQSTIGTYNYTDPRTTRISIVTYNSQAKIIADLDKYQSTEEFIEGIFSPLNLTDSPEAFIVAGLTAADSVLFNGRQNNYRSNYKQLIILYAMNYDRRSDYDPVPAADRLKSKGVTIATVAVAMKGNEEDVRRIGELASGPQFVHNYMELNLVGALQGNALQANCFCPESWTQFRLDFKDELSTKYGICVRPSDIMAGGSAARFACQNWIPNGYLATDFSKNKHDFLHNLANTTTTFTSPYSFFIGLTYTNDDWYWQQPIGSSLILMNSNQSFWRQGYPITSYYSHSSVLFQQTRFGDYNWVNVNVYDTVGDYVCEVKSCDTDNYCASTN